MYYKNNFIKTNPNKLSLNIYKKINKHTDKVQEQNQPIKNKKTNNLPILPMELNIKILNFSGGFCRLRGPVFNELSSIFDRVNNNLPSIIIDRIKEWSKNSSNTNSIGYFKIIQDNHQLISSFKSTSKSAKFELNEFYLIDSSLKPYCMAIRSLLSEISNKNIQTCTCTNYKLYDGMHFSNISFIINS